MSPDIEDDLRAIWDAKRADPLHPIHAPLQIALARNEFLCAMEPITDAEPRVLMLTTMRRLFLVNMDTGEAKHIPFIHFLSAAVH